MCYLIIFNTLYTYIHNKELSRSCGLKQNVKTAVNKYSKELIDCLFFYTFSLIVSTVCLSLAMTSLMSISFAAA